MSPEISNIKELIIKFLTRNELRNFHELREYLETLNVVIGAVELRALIAEMLREGLLIKEVESSSKKFRIQLARP
ncbi:MAG: hypothetical protein QXZ10_04060 [Sulfolobales archaeon]